MILCVFGKGGSGKTAISTHLGNHLSKDNNFVGIIGADTRYGVLQRRLGKKIPMEKSLSIAILDNNSPNKYFEKINDNMYILSMADNEDILSYQNMDKTLIDEFVNKTKSKFDHLIIDCTDRATDPITLSFIQHADKIINVVESSLDGILFLNSHKKLFESQLFKDKEIFVLNKHIEENINLSNIEEISKVKMDVVISYKDTIRDNSFKCEEDKYLSEKVSEIYNVLKQEKEELISSPKRKIFDFFNSFNLFNFLKGGKKLDRQQL